MVPSGPVFTTFTIVARQRKSYLWLPILPTVCIWLLCVRGNNFPVLPIPIPFSPFRSSIISVALSLSLPLYVYMCLTHFRSDIYSYFLCSICVTWPVMLHRAVVYSFIVPTFPASLTRHFCGVIVNGVCIGNQIYWALLHTALDYTLQFSVTYTNVHNHIFTAVAR
jgi:hypothetical protein